MPKKAKAAVVIGRFQPFHNGHKHLIEYALSEAHMVVVAIGSAGRSRDIKNPWTYSERKEMIRLSMQEEAKGRIRFVAIRDHLYSNHLWIAEVQNRVMQEVKDWEWCNPEHASTFGKPKADEIILVGHQKDDSSFYLNIFGWRTLDPGPHLEINATDLRYQFLESGGNLSDDLPTQVKEAMGELRTEGEYNRLRDELKFLKSYWEMWKGTPYPVQFVTVDGVITQAGHVLLVRRNGHPGKGQWALPGGFVNVNETVQEACFRELQEETGILSGLDTLPGSIVATKVYDAPGRDLRGRIITHAFLAKLPEKEFLPKVQGADDAIEARWVSFGDLPNMESEFFADHLHIISDMLMRNF